MDESYNELCTYSSPNAQSLRFTYCMYILLELTLWRKGIRFSWLDCLGKIISDSFIWWTSRTVLQIFLFTSFMH